MQNRTALVGSCLLPFSSTVAYVRPMCTHLLLLLCSVEKASESCPTWLWKWACQHLQRLASYRLTEPISPFGAPACTRMACWCHHSVGACSCWTAGQEWAASGCHFYAALRQQDAYPLISFRMSSRTWWCTACGLCCTAVPGCMLLRPPSFFTPAGCP